MGMEALVAFKSMTICWEERCISNFAISATMAQISDRRIPTVNRGSVNHVYRDKYAEGAYSFHQ